MELFELKANIRENQGKGPARVLRRNECVPAIIYGPGTDPIKLTLPVKMIENAHKEKSNAQVFVNLTIVDDQDKEVKKCPATIKEVQLSPLSKDVLHVDFMEIDLNQKVLVNVPVVLNGKAKGIEYGGILHLSRKELQVLCLPLDTPDNIQLEVTGLGIGDSIHIKDIHVDKVEFPTEVNYTVVSIIAPKAAKGEEAA